MATGCETYTDLGDLPLEKSEPFFLDSPDPQSAPFEESVPDRWWTIFSDKELDLVIDRALDENFTLETAWHRLQTASAIARRAQADRYPELNGTAGIDFDDRTDGDSTTNFRIGLEASYEVDLWGRIDDAVQAQRLLAEASEEDYRAAALSLAGDVTTVWFQLTEANAQLDLIREQIEINETVLELLKERFAIGEITSADVLRQQQLTEATNEQQIIVRSRQEVLKHALAVLTGQPPQTVNLAYNHASRLPEPPPLPKAGLTSQLLQRRPDVRAAIRRLESADRELAAAVSDQYPRLDLTASVATAAEQPEDLFREWLFSISGQLVAPLFDAGERRAEVERATSFRDEQIARYGQTVLVAFREVQDAITQEQQEIQRIESLSRQLELTQQTVVQLRNQYLNGVVDYLAVLDALTQFQQLQRDQLQAQRRRIEFRIALYRAAAGGFITSREDQKKNETNQPSQDQTDQTAIPRIMTAGEPEHG